MFSLGSSRERIESLTARSMSRIADAGSSISACARYRRRRAICATSSRIAAAPAPEAAW